MANIFAWLGSHGVEVLILFALLYVGTVLGNINNILLRVQNSPDRSR